METTTTQLPLRTPRRTVAVAGGGALAGVAAALLFRAGVGLDPWNVLVAGLSETLSISFAIGYAAVALGLVALVRFVLPGEVTDAATTALAATVTATAAVLLVPEPAARDMEIKCAMLVVGVLIGGLGLALARAARGSPNGSVTSGHLRAGAA